MPTLAMSVFAVFSGLGIYIANELRKRLREKAKIPAIFEFVRLTIVLYIAGCALISLLLRFHSGGGR